MFSNPLLFSTNLASLCLSVRYNNNPLQLFEWIPGIHVYDSIQFSPSPPPPPFSYSFILFDTNTASSGSCCESSFAHSQMCVCVCVCVCLCVRVSVRDEPPGRKRGRRENCGGRLARLQYTLFACPILFAALDCRRGPHWDKNKPHLTWRCLSISIVIVVAVIVIAPAAYR